MKKIGLALGAGGARGLAHIVMLEAFDELGIKPYMISGTSIGAIIGGIYATGVSAKELIESVNDVIFPKNNRFWEIHKRSDLIKMFDFIDPKFRSSGGILRGNKLENFIDSKLKVKTFEELPIPLRVAATNYHTKQEVVFKKGNLLPAIRASFSLPGLFMPVLFQDKILIDGGMVNPLPYDLLTNKCDVIIAVDVAATKPHRDEILTMPASYEVLFSSFQIMQSSIVNEKIKLSPPDFYIKTDIKGVRVHEFTKVQYIFERSTQYKNKLKSKLESLIEANIQS